MTIDLYPGLLLTKVRSNRIAQVAGMDNDYVYLTWEDDGSQTRVRRRRFRSHAKEWKPVVYYEEQEALNA